MPHLKAYHRPLSVEEALRLLARPGVNTAVLAGGTYLSAHLDEVVDEVVDLQAIGLDDISQAEGHLRLGALVRLQTIVEDEQLPDLLREGAYREGPNTLRHAATIGGVIVGEDWESEMLAALLVFEAEVEVRLPPPAPSRQRGGGEQGIKIPLAEFLADVPSALQGGLVTAVTLTSTGKTASERVARTPADKPIVAVAGRLDDQSQVRLALCGVAKTPVVADPGQLEAHLNPPGDFRGSSEYRRQMAITLARRVMANLRDE